MKGNMTEIRGEIHHSFWRDENALFVGDFVIILSDEKSTVEALVEALFYISRDRANKPKNYGEYRRVISEITGEICADMQKGPSSISLQDVIQWAKTRPTLRESDESRLNPGAGGSE
jgi:hypothetical protein